MSNVYSVFILLALSLDLFSTSLVGQTDAIDKKKSKELLGYWILIESKDRRGYLRFLPDGKVEKGKIKLEVGDIGLTTYGLEIEKSDSGTWKVGVDWLETTFGNEANRQPMKLTKLLKVGQFDLYRRLKVEKIRKTMEQEKAKYAKAKKLVSPHANSARITGFWNREYGSYGGASISIKYFFESDGTFIQVAAQKEGGSTVYKNLVKAQWIADETSIFVEFPNYVWNIPYKSLGGQIELGFRGGGKIEMEKIEKGDIGEEKKIKLLIERDAIEKFEN